MSVSLTLPLRLYSEANGSHGHWAAKARRVKAQRGAVALALRPHKAPPLPATVTITRVGAQSLDGDNLQRSAKAVRDEIAAWLGVDDRDGRVTWEYRQEKARCRVVGARRVYDWAVEIVVRALKGGGGE
jgi:hypothetical protein